MDEYTNCLNCKFFLFFDEDEELDEIYGNCRRFPPVQKNENAALRGCYDSEPLAYSPREWSQPVVEADDWCGEFSQSNIRMAREADQGHAGMECEQFGGGIVSVSTLERFAELVAQLESIGAGGVHGPLIGCASPPTAQAEGWISVDERLPEPDGPVLAHNGKWTGVAAWMSGEYLEPLERWQDEHREFIEMMGPAITHWMPLPLPPTSAEGVEHG